MNAPASSEVLVTPIANLPTIGAPLDGGFYAGLIRDGGKLFALIVAPKVEGETCLAWGEYGQEVPGATSYSNGSANTSAMAEAGSPAAKWAAALTINGRADWYLPAQDELEIAYRNLKPTSEENTLYARSGINLSAIDPTRPYTPDSPAQTTAEAFAQGGAEAFEPAWYWTSTQRSALNAWLQYFVGGSQFTSYKDLEGRVRAVRRLSVIE